MGLCRVNKGAYGAGDLVGVARSRYADQAPIQDISRRGFPQNPRYRRRLRELRPRTGRERPQNGAKQRVALSTENPYAD